MAKEPRPIGITILALLEAISSLVTLGLGFLIFAAFNLFSFRPLIGGLVTFMGAMFIILGMLNGFLAWGLWNGQKWARTTTLIVTGIGTILSLFALPMSFLRLFLDFLILYYLTRPHVKQYFEQVTSSVQTQRVPQDTQQKMVVEAPRFCDNCGAPLPQGAGFCFRCGKQMRK